MEVLTMSDDRTGVDRRSELDMVREIATHASDIRHIQEDMDKMLETMQTMQKTLIDINVTLSEAKGGWRVLMVIGGAAGTVGAGVVQLVHWWSK
jgi:ribosomal protein S5